MRVIFVEDLTQWNGQDKTLTDGSNSGVQRKRAGRPRGSLDRVPRGKTVKAVALTCLCDSERCQCVHGAVIDLRQTLRAACGDCRCNQSADAAYEAGLGLSK